MSDKKIPAALGQAPTGKSFITEAAREYRASAGVTEARSATISEISSFSSFSSAEDATADIPSGDQLAAVSRISSFSSSGLAPLRLWKTWSPHGGSGLQQPRTSLDSTCVSALATLTLNLPDLPALGRDGQTNAFAGDGITRVLSALRGMAS